MEQGSNKQHAFGKRSYTNTPASTVVTTVPLVVGICGGSCSGKTTLAKRLRNRLGEQAILLSHDNYYLPRRGLTPEQKSLINYDHPDALETSMLIRHLKELKKGRKVFCPIYDYHIHDRKKRRMMIKPAPVILLEGILIFQNEELRQLIDYKIFVATSDEERLLRRIRRDQRKRGRGVEEIKAQFFQSVQPMHEQFVQPCLAYADRVVDGETSTKIEEEELVQLILAMCNEKENGNKKIVENEK